VRLPAPRVEVPLAALDVPPRRCPVERLQERVSWQTVGLFEARGDVPPHVDQHAAEVEDDPADHLSGRQGSFGRGLHDAVR
jgi:hypothetical protein